MVILTLRIMFHQVEVSVFCYGTESPEKVTSAVATLFPGIRLKIERKQGHYDTPILILSSVISASEQIDAFFKRLGGEVINEILSTLEKRVDERGVLYIRLDKQSLITGKVRLTTGGDSILIKCKPEMNQRSLMENIRRYIISLMGEQTPTNI